MPDAAHAVRAPADAPVHHQLPHSAVIMTIYLMLLMLSGLQLMLLSTSSFLLSLGSDCDYIPDAAHAVWAPADAPVHQQLPHLAVIMTIYLMLLMLSRLQLMLLSTSSFLTRQ